MTNVEVSHGDLSRRRFLRGAAGMAISIPAIAAGLSACSGGQGALGGGGTSSSGKVTELIVPVNTSPWLGAYKKVAAAYQAESGVKITFREFPYSGLRTAMLNAIRGGNNMFDLFPLDEPWTGEFYSNNWVAPLTDVDPSFELDPQIAEYHNLLRWDSKERKGTKSGQVVALPIEGSLTLFMYRKDLYDELGLSVPKTFEEALANGRKAQHAGKAKYGYVARGQATRGGQSITFDFMPVLYGYGGGWFDENWKPLVNRPEALKAMHMYKDLLSVGPAHPNTVGLNAVFAAMESGQALQIHTVASAAHLMNDQAKSNVAGKVGFAPMPAGSGGTSAPASNAWSLAIPKMNSKERQQAALKYMSWLLDKQTQLKFTKAGGIPTRGDAFQPGGLPKDAQEYLAAVSSSLPKVKPALRYTFAAKMTDATEPILSSIVSGRTPLERGMNDLARKLADIARGAGYGR